MLKRIMTLSLVAAASVCLAIEEPIVTDTTHPTATLAPLSGLQGFSKDLRVFVRENGQKYALTSATSVVMYYGSNLTSMYVGTATSASVDTNTGAALVRTVPLPPGNFRYALGLVENGRTNDLGTGLLTVQASSFGGGFAPIPGQTIDWSTLTWTGSNQPVRSGSATINGLPITNGAAIVVSGGGGNGAVSSVTNGTGLSVSPASATGSVTLALSDSTTASLARADSALQSYTETDPNWAAVSNTVTAGAALGSTALQSYTETDPKWTAVSNTVTAGAALGSTALQSYTETDPGYAADSNNLVRTNDSRLVDARTPLAHDQAWSTITSTPTTISGYGITNAVETELDPVYGATSTVILAHVNSKHSLSLPGGFQGGEQATADYGGAIGWGAVSDAGGAMGRQAWSDDGGSIGRFAKTGNGFAGGQSAIASTDGTGSGTGIDAIQLGTGGNTNPLTLGVYGYQLMASNGVIPNSRISSDFMTNNGGPYTISVVTATQSNQPPTLAQVEALTLSSVEFLLSTNPAAGVTNFQTDTTTVYRLELPDGMVNGTASVIYANINQYPVGWVFTNQTFTSFGGGVGNMTLWCRESGPGSASHKPEFYFISVDGSNVYEFAESAVAQAVPAGTPFVKQEWNISYMATTLPKVCYGAIRMKVTAISGTPTVEYGVGPTWVSHLVLSIPQNLILEPVYAAIYAVTNGTITNATYAAQDGITISGQTLNLGTNLFGGGGGSSTPTNWSQYPAGSTVIIGTNYISNTGTGGVWISTNGEVTLSNTGANQVVFLTNGIMNAQRSGKQMTFNPNSATGNVFGVINTRIGDGMGIKILANNSGYVYVHTNLTVGIMTETPSKTLEVNGDLRLTAATNRIWFGTNYYEYYDTVTGGKVGVVP